MKTIFTIGTIILLACCQCMAQTNSQEAQLTYKMAMEAYDKGDYTTCSNYLDDVIKLDSNSAAKVSYLKVKCLEPGLFDNKVDDSKFPSALYWISKYLGTGADENKKNELLSLKIKLEHDPEYKMYKEVEGFTQENIKNKILELLFIHTDLAFAEPFFDTIFFKDNCSLVVSVVFRNSNSRRVFHIIVIDLKPNSTTGTLHSEYFECYYHEDLRLDSNKKRAKLKKACREDVVNFPVMGRQEKPTASDFMLDPFIRNTFRADIEYLKKYYDYLDIEDFIKVKKDSERLAYHYLYRMTQICKIK